RELPQFDRPVATPEALDQYAELMFDLQVLAFQADLTRVITFVMGREGPSASRPYPELGITDLHHTLSHPQNNAAAIAKHSRINRYHSKIFNSLLKKLESTRDGDGNLLDHALVLYGSGLSNGNIHQHDNLPVLLAGGSGTALQGGRHVRVRDLTPMTNLHLTVLDKLGIEVEKFGDSTGKLGLLSV